MVTCITVDIINGMSMAPDVKKQYTILMAIKLSKINNNVSVNILNILRNDAGR
jgi:hypothetical protein